MLLPWHIKNERPREVVSNGLRAFTGYALVWRGSDQTTSPDQQHEAQRITAEMCQEVLQALHSQTDLERHAWIAAFPVEHDYLFSLLHAEVDPETGARVDLLLSLVKPNDVRTTGSAGYDGFGELRALTMELERLGVTRLEVPLPLDTHRTGLTYAGWIERTPGVFIWENPGRADSSH